MKNLFQSSHTIETSFKTHHGRRKNNEDSVFCYSSKKNKGLLAIQAIADGMGGYYSGEAASRIAIEHIKHSVNNISTIYENKSINDTIDEITNLYREINDSIFKYAKDHSVPNSQIGTTLVVAWHFEKDIIISHIGDSRAYFFNGTDLMQITHDHSAVAESLDKGLIKENEISKLPFKDALTRCLGVDSDSIPDISLYTRNELGDNYAMLLCSDGAYKWLSDIEIIESIIYCSSIDETSERLLSLAFINSSDDNISVAMSEIGQISRTKRKIQKVAAIDLLQRKITAASSSDSDKRKKYYYLAATIITLLIVLIILFLLKILRNIDTQYPLNSYFSTDDSIKNDNSADQKSTVSQNKKMDNPGNINSQPDPEIK